MPIMVPDRGATEGRRAVVVDGDVCGDCRPVE